MSDAIVFLRIKAVLARVGLARTSLYDAMERGDFPKPYKLTGDGRAIGWRSDEIEAWMDSRLKKQ